MRVYEYGCLAPVSGEEAIVGVLRARSDLWNKLIETERELDRKRREVYARASELASLGVLEKEIEFVSNLIGSLREEIKRERKLHRQGSVALSARMLEDLNRFKGCLARLKAQYKEARKGALDGVREELEQLEEERRQAVQRVDDEFKRVLWWPNRDEERVEYENARKRLVRSRSEGQKAELRFHRFDGTGKATVRLRERGSAGPWGMPVGNIFIPNSVCWMRPVPPEAWTSPVRAERRRKARTVLHFRVGTDADGNPVWAVLPMVMHRPLPEGGVVRQVSVVRERVGRHFRYKAVFTVQLFPNAIKEEPLLDGVVAVDVGWRRVESGIRVAVWLDDHGNHGEVIIPDRLYREFLRLKELQSLRDTHFNEAKKILVEFLKKAQGMPEWLLEECRSLKEWRSPGRLVSLLGRWKKNCFPGDKGILNWLSDWQQREDHLYDWQSHLRDQILRHRREIYRIFASQLADKYGVVVLEDFDLRKVVKTPPPEEGTQGSIPPDYQRFIVAPSELRLCIVNACAREGVSVSLQPAAFTTLRCHACGYVEKFDAAREIWHRCPKCGELWDQDYNACVNLLERYFSKESADS
ncbi:zinc ribbon domain-containing protein [Thermodesulfitimonas autotrophica]|uniref:zinc ribbon domain-containing protein n=1 Tax=Thermodesulfitimonas autotrophica TaxID=1894989 RepID=UPI0014745F78|nr:zinc ribbon domain-containing protein [Thermodesulfitimonas autotrophica]